MVETGFRLAIRRVGAVDAEAAFLACYAEETGAFWLDSSQTDETAGRWSFLGSAEGPLSQRVVVDLAGAGFDVTDAEGTRHHEGDLLVYLSAELERMACPSLELPFDFQCGFVGWFGYEWKSACGARRHHRASTPDAALVFADRVLAVDHSGDGSVLVALVDGTSSSAAAAEDWFDRMEARLGTGGVTLRPPPGPVSVGLRLGTSYDRYLADVRRCLECIAAGESYEICLTHRIEVDTELDPLDVYRRLRRDNPAPFAAFLDLAGTRVLCASPERFLRVSKDRRVESKPIKGTAPRGATPAEDRALRDGLARSEKDRAENLMIVDLLRNDLGKVCEIGSVHVPVLMGIETFESVHQMVSTVRGVLRSDRSALDCLAAGFPGGSMTGAPKLRTMAILDELEPVARGVYSGSIGYLGLHGTADLNIVIRTIVADEGGCSIGVGGAVIALSDPEQEFEETLVKAQGSIAAIFASAGRNLQPGDYAAIGAAFRSRGSYRTPGGGQRWQDGQ